MGFVGGGDFPTHNLLNGDIHPDTVAETPNAGDLIYGTSAPSKWDRLGVGTTGEVLTVSGGLPEWKPLPTTATSSYFFNDNASDLGGIYKEMAVTLPGAGETSRSASLTGAAVAIGNWATPIGFPATTFIPQGTWHTHIHANITAGSAGAAIFAQIYKRTQPGGVETLLGTTDNVTLNAVKNGYDLDTALPDTILATTDRLVIKWFGNKVGGGTDPTVALYYMGDDASRMDFPVSSSSLDHGTLLGLADDDHLLYQLDLTGSSRVLGLFGGNNAGTPNTQYDLTATQIMLGSATALSRAYSKLNPGSFTNNVSTAGPAANGRDVAGAFGANSYIHFYFIYNPTTDTVATISSATAPPTGPALPSGYTHWAYATTIRFDAGSALMATRVRGHQVTYVNNTTTTNRVLTAGASTIEASVSLSSFAPTNAAEIILHVFGSDTDSVANSQSAVELRMLTGVAFLVQAINSQVANILEYGGFEEIRVPNMGASVIYIWTTKPGTATVGFFIDVVGYTVCNGDA